MLYTLDNEAQAVEFALRCMHKLYLLSRQVGLGRLDETPTLDFEQFARRMAWFTGKRKGKHELYIDYFCGRMMKTNVTVDGNKVEFNVGRSHPGYQSWSRYTTLDDVALRVLDEMTAPK